MRTKKVIDEFIDTANEMKDTESASILLEIKLEGMKEEAVAFNRGYFKAVSDMAKVAFGVAAIRYIGKKLG